MARVAILLLLAGCSETDPYARPGMWQPTGANTLNLSAMLMNPNDLVHGRGTRGTPAIEAAPPVTRYWAGRITPLPLANSEQTAGQGRTEAAPATPAAGTN